MRIILHAPYGMLSEESGILFILGKYLSTLGHEVLQLRCNGVFSLCDRDSESAWKRGLTACLQCQSEQKTIASWGGLPLAELSECLSAADISESRSWISFLEPDRLLTVDYNGIKLFDLCQGSFRNRFGLDQPDVNNRNHELVLRRLLLATLRMSIAARRLHQRLAPNLSFVAGGRDFITASYVAQAEAQKREVALFQWILHQRSVRITHPNKNRELMCSLLLEDVSSMRPDCKTWPIELCTVLKDIMGMLEISGDISRPEQKQVS